MYSFGAIGVIYNLSKQVIFWTPPTPFTFDILLFFHCFVIQYLLTLKRSTHICAHMRVKVDRTNNGHRYVRMFPLFVACLRTIPVNSSGSCSITPSNLFYLVFCPLVTRTPSLLLFGGAHTQMSSSKPNELPAATLLAMRMRKHSTNFVRRARRFS